MGQFVIISTVLSVALLPFVFYRAYKSYRIALLRHRLFVARDDLFIAWAALGQSYENPAYVHTRTTINGMIRFAHRWDLFEILSMVSVLSVTKRDGSEDERRSKDTAFKTVGDTERSLLESATRAAHLAILSHAFYTSLPCFFVAILHRCLGAKLRLDDVLKKTERAAPDTWTVIDSLPQSERKRDAATALLAA